MNIRRMTCTCCGASTAGRQWHNMDTGFGLCPDCEPLCRRGEGENFERTYGVKGVNWGQNLVEEYEAAAV